MRISTAQIFNRSADNISNASSELVKIQQQLSTGKKVLTPSDDPLASAQIIKLTREVEKTEQYQENIDISRRRISLEESTLDSVNNATLRIKELAIQAKSGAVSDTDRGLIASELEQLESQLLGLMNTKDVQGEYLFSGFQGFTQAYSFDGASNSYVFNGDEGRRFIQVGPDTKIASTDSGFSIFEQVDGVLSLTAATGTEFSERIITNHEDFQQFTDTRGPATITFNAGGTYTVTDSAGDPVYSGNPAVELTNVDYSAGDLIEFEGVQLTIDASVADGDVVTLDTEAPRTNVLNMVHDLRLAISSIDTDSDPAGNAKLDEAIDRALLQIEGIQNSNIDARGSIGGRVNTLDAQQEVNDDFLLFTKEARSSFQDLDYNEAISEFTLGQTALNAAYSSFAQIQQLSLFNFIR